MTFLQRPCDKRVTNRKSVAHAFEHHQTVDIVGHAHPVLREQDAQKPNGLVLNPTPASRPQGLGQNNRKHHLVERVVLQTRQCMLSLADVDDGVSRQNRT